MGPKIRAAIEFLERGGEEVVITSLGCLERALDGSTQIGTHIFGITGTRGQPVVQSMSRAGG
jgi:carbamate kinase